MPKKTKSREDKFIILHNKKIPLVKINKDNIINGLKKEINSDLTPLTTAVKFASSSRNILINEGKQNGIIPLPSINQEIIKHASNFEENTNQPSLTNNNEEVKSTPECLENIRTKLTLMHSTNMKYNSLGFLPLHNFIMRNNDEMVRLCLLKLKQINFLIDCPTRDDLYMPLHLAVLNKCSKNIINHLLHNEANLLHQDKYSKNVYHYSIENNVDLYIKIFMKYMYKNSVEILKNWCFQKNGNREIDNINSNTINFRRTNSRDIIFTMVFTAVDDEGNTPLMHCLIHKRFNYLHYIIANIPKHIREYIINFRNPRNGKTILFMISELTRGQNVQFQKFLKCAKLLIANGGDPEIQNYAGLSAFTAALVLQNYKFSNFLNNI